MLGAIEGVRVPTEPETMIIIDMKEEFKDAFSYAKSLLDANARGYAAYGLTEKLLLKNYYQRFEYDPSKPVLKTAGENVPDRNPFDIMQNDGREITLAIEEKSLWYYETPKDISEVMGEIYSKLKEAVKEFWTHGENAEKAEWIVPEKGYAIVIYITPEKIFIKWTEVKPEEG